MKERGPTGARAGQIGLKVVLVLAGLAIGGVVAELALATAGVAPTYRLEGARVALDPERLFHLVPHSGPDIDALGLRDREVGPKPSGTKRLLAVGDSFTAGFNVPVEATFPKRLETRLGAGWEVLNLGVPAYGPDQELRSFLRLAPELDPDAVVLTLFPQNDFNDLVKNGLVDIDASGRLVFVDDNPVARVVPRSRLLLLVRHRLTGSYLARDQETALIDVLGGDRVDLVGDPADPVQARKIALMAAVLERFREEAAARRLPLAVVVVPSFEALVDPRWFVKRRIDPGIWLRNEELAVELAVRAAIPVLDLTPVFRRADAVRLYDPDDHHLSGPGNRLVARELAGWLRHQPGFRELFGEGAR